VGVGKFNDRHTTVTTSRDGNDGRATSRRFPRAVPGQNALFTMRMEDMRAAYIVEERQNAVFTMRLQQTRGAVVFSLPSAVKSCGLQTKSSAPKRLPSCRRYFILFYSTYFAMSANRHEFKDPKLIAEFDIQRPEEGSGRKTDVAHCHHCQWNQALHALRMKRRL
jgi:hypothetical protein